jgi:hypothetical protein
VPQQYNLGRVLVKKSIMTVAALTLAIGPSPTIAQMAPQTTDQSMPAQSPPQQTMPSQPGTETAPAQSPEAGMAMSDADKRKMASCMKKSHDAMIKDSKCAAMMEAHPEMMSKPN